MYDHLILIVALVLIYYHIGGLATTNILRLTKGNELTIHSTKCVCASCGHNIPPYLQLPIISFIICRGKCKYCGAKIPRYPLFMEILLTVVMSLISICFMLKIYGILFSFLFYEIVRIITVLIKGRRSLKFTQQYFISVVSMIPFFLSAWFVSALYQIV